MCHLFNWDISNGEGYPKLSSTHDLWFAGDVDPTTRRRKSLFSNTLVLPGFNLYEALKVDDPKKLAWKKHLFDLRGRHLEEAMLAGADLTKADLTGAHLKSASLDWAQLQGATLDQAQLQGASLKVSQLQGASLSEASLQGASLEKAQLQGASLVGAHVNAVDFSDAFLWRTEWGQTDSADIGAIQFDATFKRWKPVWKEEYTRVPVPWDAEAYAKLRGLMNSMPEDEMRDDALERIERLDCGNRDKTLATCDPAAKPPREVLDWQKKLARASVGDADFAKALATELRRLACTGDGNAIYILRGIINSRRLAETDREAPALTDFIMSKDCPVSASLTNDDKAKLLKIKQEAEWNFAPPPTSKKEK